MKNSLSTNIKILLLCLILIFLFSYPFLFLPLWSDQAIFAYIGTIINQGGIPYVDAWDLKPPVIYYLYSLGLKIFGHTMMGLRFFDLMYFMMTIFSIYLLGSFLFDKRTGFCSGVTLGILYFFTNDFTTLSQCESFMVLPMILSVYLCCIGTTKQNRLMLLGAGFFLGIVFMTKPTGILVLIPIGLYMTSQIFRQTVKPALRLLLSGGLTIICGFVIFLAICFAWFYEKGGLSELLYTVFVYDTSHFRAALNLKKDYGHVKLTGFMRRYLFVLIPAFFAFYIKEEKNRRSENLLLYSWALTAILAFFIQGRYYPYHIVPIIAPLSIMGARGLLMVWSDPAWNKKISFIKKKVVLCFVITLFLIAAVRPHILLTYHFSAALFRGEDFSRKFNDRFFKFMPLGFSFQTTLKVAEYIRENTSKKDFIFIWGFQPLVYFLAERQAPTQFIFNAPLVAPFNIRRDLWRRKFLNDVKNNPPQYILVVENDYLQNQLMSNIIADSLTIIKDFPNLSELLDDNYIFEKKIDNFYLYHYNGR